MKNRYLLSIPFYLFLSIPAVFSLAQGSSLDKASIDSPARISRNTVAPALTPKPLAPEDWRVELERKREESKCARAAADRALGLTSSWKPRQTTPT